MLFCEPKIPKSTFVILQNRFVGLSVLFCEPKIPKLSCCRSTCASSLDFQCSSASRKFRKKRIRMCSSMTSAFSALLRAENSENSRRCFWRNAVRLSVLFCEPKIPKSKFFQLEFSKILTFSALLRAENSEIRFFLSIRKRARRLSVLFCEPKIPKLGVVQCKFTLITSFSALLRAENSEMGAACSQQRCSC